MKTFGPRLLAATTLLIVCSCGTWLGNPGDGDDDADSGEQKNIPTISFDLPLPNGLALAGDPDDMLTDWVERFNDTIDKVNGEIDRINESYEFTEPTSVTGKGPDGNESAVFTELGEGVYDYQVVICNGGQPANLTRWSADGKHITSDRDLKQKPDGPEDVRVRTVYDEDSAKTLTVQFYGVPKGIPADVDGTSVASWDEARQVAEGFTVRGVRAWFDPGEALSPDDYLTGQLSAAGAGEFVGWSTRAPNTCGDIPAFSESAPEDQWCNSRKIGAESYYTLDEAKTAWLERLQPIGVAPAANLGDVTIPNTCP